MGGRGGLGFAIQEEAESNYWQEKERKLREQRAPASGSGIFKNVTCWINGFCDGLSPDEIIAVVRQNGGRVEHTYRASTVTHIVASSLASSKLQKLQEGKKGICHVVSPMWLVESVKIQKLLPVCDFQPPGLQVSTRVWVQSHDELTIMVTII